MTNTATAPLATFDVYADPVRPHALPPSAWPHILHAAVTGKATGSVGAKTADPSTGVDYRIAFRRTTGAHNVVSTTSIADVYLVDEVHVGEPTVVDLDAIERVLAYHEKIDTREEPVRRRVYDVCACGSHHPTTPYGPYVTHRRHVAEQIAAL